MRLWVEQMSIVRSVFKKFVSGIVSNSSSVCKDKVSELYNGRFAVGGNIRPAAH